MCFIAGVKLEGITGGRILCFIQGVKLEGIIGERTLCFILAVASVAVFACLRVCEFSSKQVKLLIRL